MKKAFLLSFVMFAVAGFGSLNAASDIIGGAFSTDGNGARPMGMGGAFSAVADDANATYTNPAGMAFFKDKDRKVAFTHSNLFSLSSLSRDFVAYAQADEGIYGALGLSWNRFSAQFNPESYTEDTYMYSGAKLLSGDSNFPKYAVGWNLKYYKVTSGFSTLSSDNTTVNGGNATGYGADLGLMIKLRETLTVSLVGQDIYSTTSWDSGRLEILPAMVVGGVAYHFTDQMLFAGEGRMAQTSAGFETSSWHVGSEYWFLDGKSLQWGIFRNFAARAGYQQILANSDGGQVSAGASATADNWQLDYAFQTSLSSSALGSTQRFGLSLMF